MCRCDQHRRNNGRQWEGEPQMGARTPSHDDSTREGLPMEMEGREKDDDQIKGNLRWRRVLRGVGQLNQGRPLQFRQIRQIFLA